MAFQFLKGVYKKDGDKLFSRAYYDRTRANGFELKVSKLRLKMRSYLFYNECIERLKEVAQRGGGCPIPGKIQDQVGWVS